MYPSPIEEESQNEWEFFGIQRKSNQNGKWFLDVNKTTVTKVIVRVGKMPLWLLALLFVNSMNCNVSWTF